MAELTRRYVVMALATHGSFDLHDPDAAFVLKPWKDPAALAALRAYGERCYRELGRDLEAWIRVIEAGPVVHGDVGRRNEPHVRAAAKTRRPAKRAPRRSTPRRGPARSRVKRKKR